jgi:alpha-galactosidase
MRGGVSWEELQIKGRHKVRDLWRQEDLGTFGRRFEGLIPSHGVLLLKVSKA